MERILMNPMNICALSITDQPIFRIGVKIFIAYWPMTQKDFIGAIKLIYSEIKEEDITCCHCHLC